MALTMLYNNYDMEWWIYDFPYCLISVGVIAENNLEYCVSGFVFSLFLLIYEGVISKKMKKSGIGVVYTSGVSIWIYRKTCVNVNSGIIITTPPPKKSHFFGYKFWYVFVY